MKYRRLKNRDLDQHHLWPRIVLMLFMLVVFVALDMALVYMFLQSIIGNKILEGYKNSQRIIEMMNEGEGQESFVIRDLNNMKRIIPGIKSVVIVDKDNKVIEKYGNEVPDFSKEVKYFFSGDEFTIIPEVSEKGGLFINGNGRYIDVASVLKREDYFAAFAPPKSGDFSYKWVSEDWFGFECWYITSVAGTSNKACVKGIIAVSRFELFCVTAAFLFALFVAIIFFLWQFVEFIRLFAEHRKAYRIIHSDLVTGGNNKHLFLEMGEKYLKRQRQRKYAIAQLKLEKYRGFCMYYGEEEGEKFLCQIYECIGKNLVKREFLAHEINGIYALLLIYEDEAELSKRIYDILKKLDDIRPEQKLYFSVGITKATNYKNVTNYYTEASIARASVKEDGEERVLWFSEEMKAAQIWERKVENDMEKALSNREFQVYLQPKYSTREEVLSGAEALIRWIHPTEGFIPPGRFIPIFEKNGFVLKIDDFMITEVAKLQSGWLKEGKKIVPISVNVSRAHFTREDLAEHICRIVDSYEVPHEYIELELTESAFFDDKEVLLKTVNKMKELGFHVSMDDFGAGYSSLNSLKELPLDVVKLDAEFFRGADNLERANLIVSRTIGLAKQLGMTIVAEGIETREQVDFLAGQDCDLIQGFYFAKPMPVSDFEEKAFNLEKVIEEV